MRVLLTGASGHLGGYLLRELQESGASVIAWSGSRAGTLCGVALQPVNLAEPDEVAAAFAAARPTLIIHAGAMASLAECFRDPERAERVNSHGSRVLA